MIDGVTATAYRVPTETDEESDGTLVWDSTDLVVVEVTAGEHTGLGYTFCHPAALLVIQDKLAGVVTGRDPAAPEAAWAQMQTETRQMGHAGIAQMAVSAVDIALWDLKARLVDRCLADVLSRWRERAPSTGQAGSATTPTTCSDVSSSTGCRRAARRSSSRSAATSCATPSASPPRGRPLARTSSSWSTATARTRPRRRCTGRSSSRPTSA